MQRNISLAFIIVTLSFLASCKSDLSFDKIFPNSADVNMKVVNLEGNKKYIGFHNAPSHIKSPEKRLPEKLQITYDELPKGLINLDWSFTINNESSHNISVKDDELEVYLNGTDVSEYFTVGAKSAEASFNDLGKFIKQGKNTLSVEPASQGPRIEFEADTQGPILNIVKACKDCDGKQGYILLDVKDASLIEQSIYAYTDEKSPSMQSIDADWLKSLLEQNTLSFNAIENNQYELYAGAGKVGGVFSKIEFVDEHGFKTVKYFDSRVEKFADQMVKLKVSDNQQFIDYLNATLLFSVRNTSFYSSRYVRWLFGIEDGARHPNRLFQDDNIVENTSVFTFGSKDLSQELTVDSFGGVHKKGEAPRFGFHYPSDFSADGRDPVRWIDTGNMAAAIIWAKMDRLGIGSVRLNKLNFIEAGDRAKVAFDVILTDLHFFVEITSSCLVEACAPWNGRPDQPEGNGMMPPSFLGGYYEAAQVKGVIVMDNVGGHNRPVGVRFESFEFNPVGPMLSTSGSTFGDLASQFSFALPGTIESIVPYVLENSINDFDFDFNLSPKENVELKNHLSIDTLRTTDGTLSIDMKGSVQASEALGVNPNDLGSQQQLSWLQEPELPTQQTPVTLMVDKNFINLAYHQAYRSGLTHLTVITDDKKLYTGPNAVDNSMGFDKDMKVELIPSSAGTLKFAENNLQNGLDVTVEYTNARMRISQKRSGVWQEQFLVDANMKVNLIASIVNGDMLIVFQGIPEIDIIDVRNSFDITLPFGIDKKVINPLIKTFVSIASAAMADQSFEFKLPDVDEKTSVLYQIASTAVSTSTTVDQMKLVSGNPSINLAFDSTSNAKVPTIRVGSCQQGWEKQAGLCYPKCNSGYTGVLTVCWQNCPSYLTDTGAFCQDAPVIHAKSTYGRGVGVIPTGCGGKENDAGLCYDWCAPGYGSAGPMCWERCRDGYTDLGLLCEVNHLYVQSRYERAPRGGINLFSGRCSNPNEVAIGLLCYDRCPSGWDSEAFACTQRCNDGYADTGLFCHKWHTYGKSSYGRGVGTIPSECPWDKPDKDAGLCYPRCNSGYTGVGPVCWETNCSRFGPDFNDDGAFCRRDRTFVKHSYIRIGAGQLPETYMSYENP